MPSKPLYYWIGIENTRGRGAIARLGRAERPRSRGGGCDATAHVVLGFTLLDSFGGPRCLRRRPPHERSRNAASRGDNPLPRGAAVLRPGSQALLRVQSRRGDPRVPRGGAPRPFVRHGALGD